MFEDLKDKLKGLISGNKGFRKQSLEDLQAELLRAEALQQICDNTEINKILSELSFEVEGIEIFLTRQQVRTLQDQLEREYKMAKKDCYLSVLNKFAIPNVEQLKEEIKLYENK